MRSTGVAALALTLLAAGAVWTTREAHGREAVAETIIDRKSPPPESGEGVEEQGPTKTPEEALAKGLEWG